VEVSALLRTSGRTERFTRTGRVRDISATRAARAERARRERAELQAAWQVLTTDGRPVRLSAFGELDPAAFERLLDLLGRALSSRPDSTGVRRAVSADGGVEILLEGGAAADDRTARLHTANGVMSGPDYVVRISGVDTAAGREPAGREPAGREPTGRAAVDQAAVGPGAARQVAAGQVAAGHEKASSAGRERAASAGHEKASSAEAEYDQVPSAGREEAVG
jgi:hypothetical protein